MKKMMVAATVAVALFTASVAGAKQTQVKAGKESPRAEKKAVKKPQATAKDKAAQMPKSDVKVVQQPNDTKAAPAPKKATEVKK